MNFNSTELIIFGLSLLLLIFSILLWFGGPKIDSSKEKPPKRIKKIIKSNKRNLTYKKNN